MGQSMKRKNCDFCNLSSEDKKWEIYENDFWIVFMADKQDYLGRCLIMSKRHIAVNKECNPSPHLHFHVRPRYKNVVHMFGYEFVDEEFAHHYNNDREDISDELKQKVFAYLKEKVDKYLR